ncbi:hypothetical protein [Marinobacter salinexigens]|nr:hypothetical protein [Marinobacter salinexigens]
MNTLKKFFLAFSILSVSVLAQADGVSDEDMACGNHPAVEQCAFDGHG